MTIQSVKWWKLMALMALFLTEVQRVNSLLTVTPADTNATVGSQVRLSCSTDANTEVNWQYKGESVTDIYIASEGLVRLYKKTNRFKVKGISKTGQYDLVISNVTQEDGGVYICSEPEGRGIPSHARLSVTDGVLPAKMCRENVVVTKGGELQISFSSCSPQPYFLSHVAVGLSHSNDVYNLGKVLNNYADSGRFYVDITSEGLKLKVTNVQMQDAGTYTCRGDSGHGDRHNKELVVLDEMPNCNDNISDFKCIMETTEVVEVKCAVNYTGNCAPHSIWGYEYGNKSISTVKQEFVCFSETYSGVESTTIITIESGSRLICYIDDSSQDAVQKYQCNTSVVPEQCKNDQPIVLSYATTSNSSKTKLIVSVVIPTVLLIAGSVAAAVACYIRCKRSEKRRDAEAPLSNELLNKDRPTEKT